tara:strand:+ start:42 stop:431 length:390 start_codon:yes stop_codon:yes gene_type:complete
MMATIERFVTEHQACWVSLEDRYRRKIDINIDASTDDLVIDLYADGVIVWYEEGGQGFLKIEWDRLECEVDAGVEWDGSPVVLATDGELDQMAEKFGAVWAQRDGEFLHVSARISFKAEHKVDSFGRIV